MKSGHSINPNGSHPDPRLIKPAKGNQMWIERELVSSEVWLGTRNTAKKVLAIFWTKRQMMKVPAARKKNKKVWAIRNNGEIVFTYKEANEKYGISRSSFRDAIDELEAKGFIDITRPGIGRAQVTTLYGLSDRWRKYGTPDFQEKCRSKDVSYRPDGFQDKRRKTISQVRDD